MQHDARIECQKLFFSGEQRIDIDLPDPGLLDDELAEAHEEPL